MIKQRIVPTEIPQVKYICYMRSNNSGNIQGENLHILAVEHKKIIPQKLKYIFTKKLHHNYQDILGYKISK